MAETPSRDEFLGAMKATLGEEYAAFADQGEALMMAEFMAFPDDIRALLLAAVEVGYRTDTPEMQAVFDHPESQAICRFLMTCKPFQKTAAEYEAEEEAESDARFERWQAERKRYAIKKKRRGCWNVYFNGTHILTTRNEADAERAVSTHIAERLENADV